MRFLNCIALMLLIVVLAYPSCFAADREAIEFANDVQPIFARNCVACHNDNLAEGGLNLESHAALVKGGDSGESFVAGQPESSYLLSRVNGDEEPWMPPEDNAVGANRLTPAELEIIESWIEQGATVGSPATKSMIRLKPPPSRLQPTYDMEFAPDGSFLTYGRGSTAYVLPVHRSHIGKLPSAKSTPLLESKSAETTTHLDLVQSIAVSPDSQRIATGGYKQVKLWRQKRIQSEFMSDLVHAGKRFTLSPDGRHLAYQTGDSTFEIVHLERGVSQRYLKTHQQPLATLAWIDDANLLTYDHRGNCSKTNIDGNQESYDLHSDSVGVALAAEFVDQWLYVAHGNDSGKVNLSRRSIATPDISSEWNTVVADLAVADGSENSAAHIATSAARKIALAVGQTIFVLDCESWQIESRIQTESPIQTIAWNQAGTQLVVGFRSLAPGVHDAKSGELVFSLSDDYAASQRLRFLENQLAIREVQRKKAEERIQPAKDLAEKESKAVTKLTDARDKAAQAQQEAAKAVTEIEGLINELEAKLSEVASRASTEDGESDSAPSQAEQEKSKQQLAEKRKSIESLRSKLKKSEADLAERQQALAAAIDSAKVTADRIPIIESEVARIVDEIAGFNAQIQVAKLRADLVQENSKTNSVAVLFHEDQIIIARADRLSFFSATDGSPIDTLVFDGEQISHLCSLAGSTQFLAYTHPGRAYSISVAKEWELEHSWGSLEQDVFPDRITALDFSPDGRRLAIGSGMPSRGGSIYFIELDEKVDPTIKTWAEDLHSDQVLSLSFSPDGRYLASGAADKICRILETENANPVRKLEGHSHHILGISWRWDGQTLATASGDGTTKVWNVDEATQLKTLTGLAGENTAVQFIGTTNTLVAVSTGSHARRMDAGNGKVLSSLGNSKQPLFTVTTGSSPSLVAAAGQIGSIWIWNAESGKLEAHIESQMPEEVQP